MTRTHLVWTTLATIFLFPARATLADPADPPQVTLAVLLADVAVEAEAVLDLPAQPGAGAAERGAGRLSATEAERLRKGIDALRKLDLAKVLAEPTLVTLSGRPASFLSGGEVPVSVPAGLGQVGVQFHDVGTRIDFLPRLQATGNLHLEIEAEHSTLNDPATGKGSPARTAFRFRTTAELAPGQVLVLHHLVPGEANRKHRRIALIVPTFETSATPLAPAGPGPVKITAANGRVQIRCPHFEATADRLEQDGQQFLLTGKVQFRTGERAGTPTELSAEALAIRFESGRLRLRVDGPADRR